jgi:uncharacterized protein
VTFRLLPRQSRVFSDFIAFSEHIRHAAVLLEEMLAGAPPAWDKADEVKSVEHTCDALTRDIIHRLLTAFVTPLDREDIHQLARSLDDVVDAIDASAARVRLYRVTEVRPEALELAGIITASTDQVVLAITALEGRHGVAAAAVEINRLENEADRVHQAAVGRLFAHETDPVVVLKWKEILDILESATDRCEDVANVVEGLVVKHA